MLFSIFTTSALAVEEIAENISLQSLPFSDVPNGSWFFPYVQFVYTNGVMQGTSPAIFAPNVTFSRAQVVATLFRIHHGRPANASDSRTTPFTDVPASHWSAPYIAWAYEARVVSGVGNDRFAPNDNVNRQQFAVMIANFLFRLTSLVDPNRPAGPQWSNFTDRNQIAFWAYDQLQWINSHGIITGRTATTIAPTGTATRAEAATVLTRLMNFMDIGTKPEPPVNPPNTGQALVEAVQSGMMYHDIRDLFPDADIQSAFEREVLRLVNIERANYGLSPVQWNNILGTVARAHSIDMATRGFFAHICPDGVGPTARAMNAGFYGLAAENVSAGFISSTPQEVVARWMASPPHRANVLHQTATYLGAGVSVNHTDSISQWPMLWTLKMGAVW